MTPLLSKLGSQKAGVLDTNTLFKVQLTDRIFKFALHWRFLPWRFLPSSLKVFWRVSPSLAFARMPRAEARGQMARGDRGEARRAKSGGFGAVPLGFATDAPAEARGTSLRLPPIGKLDGKMKRSEK
ncbi:MAG: hypothetical protein A2W09_00800 [Deltaproteobacteria bacterium RBG_16_50_11]|nr:MAG: hypothetical protein A2W09_00800 [Deltaproteobacteria bacterium RBG_16_50_11]